MLSLLLLLLRNSNNIIAIAWCQKCVSPVQAGGSRVGPEGARVPAAKTDRGLGFRVQGLGFRVWGSGFRVWCLGLGFRGFRVQGFTGTM